MTANRPQQRNGNDMVRGTVREKKLVLHSSTCAVGAPPAKNR